MTTLRRVSDTTDILGESPIWQTDEQALYWVDIRRPAIRRLALAAGTVETWTMPGLVGAIAFASDGRLLVAHGTRIDLFDRRSGAFKPVAHLPDAIPGHRFNDGRLDPAGRFWIGTMHNVTRAPEGTLFRLEPTGELASVRTGIAIPNSLCWSPDGGTMYFADSLDYAIRAFPFDRRTGALGPDRMFARTEPPGFPDGSTVDREGFLWTAEFNGGRVVRYAPDGRVDRAIALPVPRPTACAFGGRDLRTLFITTTSQGMSADEQAAMPLAGALLACEPGPAGLPEPRFAVPPALDLPA